MVSVLKLKGTLLACLFLCMSSLSMAQSLILSTYTVYSDYREYSENQTLLDKETGFLPGLAIAYDFSGSTREHFSVAMKFSKGAVDYAGYLQTGQPHQTKTNTVVVDISAQYFHELTASPKVALGFIYTQHSWQRDIQPAGSGLGLFEKYTWSGVLASAKYHNHKTITQVSAGALLRGNVTVNLMALGLGKIDIPLQTGYQMDMNFAYQFHHENECGLSVSLDNHLIYFDKSKAVRVANSEFSEPNSIQLQSIVKFSYEFKL